MKFQTQKVVQAANTIILSASRRKFTRVPCADGKAASLHNNLMKCICPTFIYLFNPSLRERRTSPCKDLCIRHITQPQISIAIWFLYGRITDLGAKVLRIGNTTLTHLKFQKEVSLFVITKLIISNLHIVANCSSVFFPCTAFVPTQINLPNHQFSGSYLLLGIFWQTFYV